MFTMHDNRALNACRLIAFDANEAGTLI